MTPPSPDTATGAAPAPKRGRPRDAGADAAIVEATTDLLAKVGFDGLRVDDIANAAGVSKTTIYRRWPSKVILVVEALRATKLEAIPIPDTGDVRSDLVILVTNLYKSLTSSNMGRAMPGLVAAKTSDPELAQAIESLYAARRTMLTGVIERGIARGQVRPDADIPVLLDLMAAPAYYRFMITGEKLTRAMAVRQVDAMMAGLRP